MKNLIYQCWEGNVLPSAHYGSECMKKYAETIGADYEFDINSGWINKKFKYAGENKKYYGTIKPVYEDRFLEYDNVLYVDTDIFPVENLSESIFDNFSGQIGMCQEPLQPDWRAGRVDEYLWHRMMTNRYDTFCPQREDGKFLVFNAGLVLFSREGLVHARKKWSAVHDYLLNVKNSGIGKGIYYTDQNYIHAMTFYTKMKFQELDQEWNRYITWDKRGVKVEDRKVCDPRNEHTKFVHVQMRGADDLDNDTHYRIVNRPVTEWGKDKWGKSFEENTYYRTF